MPQGREAKGRHPITLTAVADSTDQKSDPGPSAPGRPPRTGPGLFAPSRLSYKTVFTACAAVALFAAAVVVLWASRFAVVLTLVSVIVTVPLDHAVKWFQRHGGPRWLAIIWVLTAMFAALAVLVLLIVPLAVTQVRGLVEDWPDLVDSIRSSHLYIRLDRSLHLGEVLGHVVQGLRNQPGSIAHQVLTAAGVALQATIALVTVLFLVIFMLIYGGSLVTFAIDHALPERRPRYRHACDRIYNALGGYIMGIGSLVLMNAAATTIFLAIIGVPYFLPLAVLSGFASLVPFVGVLVTGTLISVVAVVSQGLWYGVATAIYITAYQQFENHVIAPLIYKRTVQLNPLLSILFLVFLGELAGVIGAILAVPALTVAKIVVSELLVLRHEQLGFEPGGGSPAQTPEGSSQAADGPGRESDSGDRSA